MNLTKGLTSILLATLNLVVGMLLTSATSLANPQGGQVVGGSATIVTPNATTVQVNQTTDKAIINWQSYNVGANEQVNYQQPNSSSIALNRINAANGVSQIYGSITANGQVWLVNPAGIFFGPSAYINVGGMLATTADVSNEDFMNGTYKFVDSSGLNGSVINKGTLISAEHGLIALIGSNVTNDGLITAHLGHAILASGAAFTISFGGNELVSFKVDKAAANPDVTNNGTISANGGKILVTAAGAATTLDKAINMNGFAEAKSVYQHNGEIIISADPHAGNIKIAGKVKASGTSENPNGGKITISGNQVSLDAGSEVEANNVRITGYNILLSASSLINANGGAGNRNGGTVFIWSDNQTSVYGTILARGGSTGGNGGFVETSSYQTLNVTGALVDTTAAFGATGTWLLDPTNIYIAANIANATTAGMSGANTSADTISGGTSQASGAVQDSLVTTGSLVAALASSNVIVTTTNASGTGIGDITVVDPISWSSANTLTLTAANNIFINAAITTGTSSSAFILNATGSVTQTAAIGGSGGITQQGAGTTTLSQSNTYTGATIVNNGVLSVTNTAGLGSASGSTITVNSGTLSLNYGAGSLGNTSPLALNGAGTGGIGGSALYNAASSGTNTVSNPITLGSAATIGANTGSTFTLSGNITNSTNALTFVGGGNINETAVVGSGAGTVTMNGSGILTMTGSNSYSGATTINSGTYVLSGANGTAASSAFTVNQGGTLTLDNTATGTSIPDRISNSAALTLNGGEFIFKGSNVASTTTAESIGSLTLPLGASTITLNSGTGGSTTLTFVNATTRTAGATILFRGTNLGANAGAGNTNIKFTAGLTLSGGGGAAGSKTISILPYAFGDTSASGNGFGFVTNNIDTNGNVNGIRPLILASEYMLDALTAGNNIRLTTGTTTAATVSINSLLLNGGLLNFGANRTVTNASGALGYISGTGITSNSNASRIVTFSQEAILYSTASYTIESNLTGSAGMTLSGSGTVTLSTQVKDITGGVTINQGNLTVDKANAINSANVVTVANTGTFAIGNFAETVSGLTLYSGGSSGASVTTGTGDLTLLNTAPANNVILNVNGSGNTGASITRTSTGTLALGAARTLTINDGGATNDLTIAVPISGAFLITKNGSGALLLSGTNTYTGGTTIDAGTVNVTALGGLGTSGTITVNNSSILNINFSGVSGGTLGNAGSLVLNNSATLSNLETTANNDTLSNAITLGSGSTPTITSNSTTSNGTFVLSGGITNSTASLLFNGTGNILVSGVIGASTGTVAMSGAGKLTLSAANTYTGVTTINSGTIQIGNAGATGSFGTNSVTNNGAIIFNRTAALTVSNVISGTGTLTQSGSGEITLSGNNSYNGSTAINAGTLALTNVGGLGSTSGTTVANNAILNLNFSSGTTLSNTNTMTLNGSGSGSGALLLTSNGITISSPITLATSTTIGGAGTGLMTLSGAISGGANTLTISLANAGISMSNASNSISTLGTVTRGGAFTLNNAGALTVNGPITAGTITNAATISTSGLLTLAGNISTSGSNNISLTGGGITQNASVIVNGSSGNITADAGTNTVTMNSGAQLLSTGTITLSADAYTINSAAQIGGSGTGTGTAAATLLQNSAGGTTIGIAGGTGTIQLTSSALNTIRSTNVRIGSLTAGAINSAAWTPGANFAASGVLTLASNGGMTQSGDINLATSNSGLFIRGAGTVTLGSANVFSNLAVSKSAGNLSITNATNTITIASLTDDSGTVDGINTTGNASLTATANTITESGIAIINAALLTTTSAGGTTLNNSNTITSFNATNSSSGNISLINSASTLTITGISQSGSGNTSITNTGAITSSAAINGGSGTVLMNASGALNFSTGSSTITTTNTGADASSAIILKGSTFTNGTGSATPFTTGTGGRFLIYSVNPSTDSRGTLTYSFKQYNISYPTAPTPTTGSGLLYTLAPTITPSLIGSVSKIYDATTTATLNGGNYSFTGDVDGDIITLNNPSSGTYASANAGTNINVAVSGIAISSATNGAATVYGYGITTTANANIGTITPASLLINADATAKTYGTNDPTFTYQSTGLYVGDSITGSLNRTISAATENAGNYSILQDSVSAGNNYNITYTPANLTINLATLIITANLSQSKVYGANDPTFTYSQTGLVNAVVDGIAISDSINGNLGRSAGENANTYNYNLGNLAASTPSNYLTSLTAGTFEITTKTLTITATAGQTKTYGTDDPSTGFTYGNTGLVNGVTPKYWDNSGNYVNGSTINDTVSGSLSRVAGQNVGDYAYTIGTVAPSASGNYIVNTGFFSTSPFAITPATLSVSGILADNKTFDDNTTATLNMTNAILSGVYLGDNVDLDTATYIANFASADVDNNIPVIVTSLTITGSSANNYQLTLPTGLTANILPSNTPTPPVPPTPIIPVAVFDYPNIYPMNLLFPTSLINPYPNNEPMSEVISNIEYRTTTPTFDEMNSDSPSGCVSVGSNIKVCSMNI